MAGMQNLVGDTPDDNYQPPQVKVRAKPSIGMRIANPPVGEPGAIVPFSQQTPIIGGIPTPAAAPPAQRPGATVSLADIFNPNGQLPNPAIKGVAWPFHNPFGGAAPAAPAAPAGPGMPVVVGPGPSSVPGTITDEVRGWQAQQVLPPAGQSITQGSQLTRGPLQRGMPGRGMDPNYTPDPVAFTGLRGMPRETNSALPALAPAKHMGAQDNLTGKAMPTDASAAPLQRQAPPAISLNQLRALTALLPRQPTPQEFGQRDLLNQITAQRQAMIDAAGNDPIKLAQAYAMGKSALERFITPGSVFSALGINGGQGMVDPTTPGDGVF